MKIIHLTDTLYTQDYPEDNMEQEGIGTESKRRCISTYQVKKERMELKIHQLETIINTIRNENTLLKEENKLLHQINDELVDENKTLKLEHYSMSNPDDNSFTPISDISQDRESDRESDMQHIRQDESIPFNFVSLSYS